MATDSRIITPAEAMAKREDAIRRKKQAEAARDAAEKAIVAAIVELAKKKNALEDLAAMEDVNIPNLTALAAAKGVSPEEWNNLITSLTPMQWQLLAVVGGTWADCWDGLKSRFPQIMEEILSELQQEQQQ